ncbi:MAG TPA: hypothetical protein DCQ56_04440 [Porphyromonadaceae bacterium]|nr:hypothetical protein [Porphyromonadaceae bacterium]
MCRAGLRQASPAVRAGRVNFTEISPTTENDYKNIGLFRVLSVNLSSPPKLGGVARRAGGVCRPATLASTQE